MSFVIFYVWLWRSICIVGIAVAALSPIVATSQSNGAQNTDSLNISRSPSPTPNVLDSRDLSPYASLKYQSDRDWQKSVTSENRRRINERYDGQDWVYKTINNPHVAGIGKITDDPAPPLFPIAESSLIVVGRIMKANAFLSNDVGSIYTEFSIGIEEVLMNSETGKKKSKNLIADREGGVVIYPNGQRILYQNSDLALPQIGNEYVLFLTKDRVSSNYLILRSYELNASGIRPMEKTSGETYRRTSKNNFIEIVRNKARQREQK
jgi:hypothetical protein